jgi:drug/metabolite transporter (DMT)-like permease
VGYFYFALVGLLWGTSWVAIKVSLTGFPPFAGAMFRFMIAIVVLAIYAQVKKISLKLPPHTTGHVIRTAVFLYVVDYGLIYWGEQYLNAGMTAIIFAALPLSTAIVSTWAFRSETLSYTKFFGISVGLAGIVIVFFDQLAVTNFSPQITMAALAVLVAAVAASLNVAIVKKHLMHVETVAVTVHQLIWGTLGLGVVAALHGEFSAIEPNRAAVAASLYLGLACSAFAFVLYYRLLRSMTASALSTITFITPLVAVVGGALFLDEAISARALIGAAVIFVGIGIVRWDLRGRPKSLELQSALSYPDKSSKGA